MKNKKFFLNALMFICFLFILEMFRECRINNRNEEANKLNGEKVGIAYKYKKTGKYKDLIYYFYHNNKKYFDTLDEHNFKYEIGKLYIVKYSLSSPQNSHILFEKEVKDTISIINSGFKHIKYYTHNISTNTYEENWKWE
jgi:hypothetical protein